MASIYTVDEINSWGMFKAEAFQFGYSAWDAYYENGFTKKPKNPYEKETDDWRYWNYGFNANQKGV